MELFQRHGCGRLRLDARRSARQAADEAQPIGVAALEVRRTQLDLRLSKRFRMRSSGRLQLNLDLYNATNGNSIVLRNDAYGPAWGTPLSVLDGRLLQISGTVTF